MATIAAAVLGAAGVGAYFLGLFDRPKFAPTKLLNNDAKGGWFAVVAICQDKNIGKHVARLISGTKAGISALPNGSELLQEGCHAYLRGRGKNSERPEPSSMPDSLCVGVFFDDPSKVDRPRWAMGWAVCGGDTSFKKLQDLTGKVQDKSGLDKAENEIRVIRLAADMPAFKGTIPWRTPITPMIAPMLHWNRAFNEFQKGGYSCTSKEGPCCLEVYVMDEKKWFASFIDYVVLHGDNSRVWTDAFP